MKWLKRFLGFRDENDKSFLPKNPRIRERWIGFAKKESLTYKQVRNLFEKQLKEIPLRLKPVSYSGI